MATYKQIQDHVRQRNGYVPKTCWIADIKSQHGLTTRRAPNRQSNKRVHPCPVNKRADIEATFRHFGMI